MNIVEILKDLIISARPKQWYKNILLFVCIVFSQNMLNIALWWILLPAFIYFCMLSSAQYILNDILDKEKDQINPQKKKRPIASGHLRVLHALIFAVFLILISLVGAYITINFAFLAISAFYLLLAFSYSLFLKKLVIADVLVISSGFVVRAVAGCLASNLYISPWLVICAFLLSLFLALMKRWQELTIFNEQASFLRPGLAAISPKLLEQLVSITAGALIVAYLLYTVFAQNNLLIATTPFVIYGLFRYLYMCHELKSGAEPEVILKDKAMLINFGIWVLLVVLIVLYGEIHP